ncbi:MAG: enolase C-terminal domain-like protein [Planctomycetota bacterium]
MLDRREFVKATAVSAAVGVANPRLGFADAVALDPVLAKHRIAKIETRFVPYRWPRLVGKNARIGVHGQEKRARIAVLTTDQGAVGWGVTSGRDRKSLQPFVGRSVAELIDPATGIRPGAPAALDIPLHDLAGVILDKPVYQMLGASGPKESPLYSGMIYFDELEPEDNPAGFDQVLANCQWDVDYGYRQLKIKIGRSGRWYPHDEGLRADIEIVRRIHDTLGGEGVRLLVDANDMYSESDVRRFLEGVAGVPLLWMEEPFREHPKKTPALRKWMQQNGFENTLLADGEFNPDRKLCQELAERGALDVCLHDVIGFGFTRWRRLIPKLSQLGVSASPHGWGSLLKTHYVAHLAAGLGNCVTIEGVTCESDAIDFGDYPLANGKLRVSNAPGFGMKLIG